MAMCDETIRLNLLVASSEAVVAAARTELLKAAQEGLGAEIAACGVQTAKQNAEMAAIALQLAKSELATVKASDATARLTRIQLDAATATAAAMAKSADAAAAAAAANAAAASSLAAYAAMTVPLPSAARAQADATAKATAALADYAGMIERVPTARLATDSERAKASLAAYATGLGTLRVVAAQAAAEIGTASVMIDQMGIASVRAGQSMAQDGHMVQGSMGRRGNAGLAILEFSRLTEDAQYGLAGVLNNIPTLVMAMGGAGGLAGVISLVAVGANTLYKYWGDVASLWDGGATLREADRVKKLADATKEHVEHVKKLKGLQSDETKRTESAVTSAIAETPGGYDAIVKQLGAKLLAREFGDDAATHPERFRNSGGSGPDNLARTQERFVKQAGDMLVKGAGGDSKIAHEIAGLMAGSNSEFAFKLREALIAADGKSPEAMARAKDIHDTAAAAEKLRNEAKAHAEHQKSEDDKRAEKDKKDRQDAAQYEDKLANRTFGDDHAPRGGQGGGGGGDAGAVGGFAGGHGGGHGSIGVDEGDLATRATANVLAASIGFDRRNARGPTRAQKTKAYKEATKDFNDSMFDDAGNDISGLDDDQREAWIKERADQKLGKGDPARDRQAFEKTLRDRLRSWIHNQRQQQGFTEEQIGDSADKMADQILAGFNKDRQGAIATGQSPQAADLAAMANLQEGMANRGLMIQRRTVGVVNEFAFAVAGIQENMDLIGAEVNSLRRQAATANRQNFRLQSLLRRGH